MLEQIDTRGVPDTWQGHTCDHTVRFHDITDNEHTKTIVIRYGEYACVDSGHRHS